MATPLCFFRCRMCRERVFEAEHVVTPHGQQYTYIEDTVLPPSCVPSEATLWHVTDSSPPQWIVDNIEKAQWTKGKLSCPKCGSRLGLFDFVTGMKCACGQFTAPPIHIVGRRVDLITPNLMTSPLPSCSSVSAASTKDAQLTFDLQNGSVDLGPSRNTLDSDKYSVSSCSGYQNKTLYTRGDGYHTDTIGSERSRSPELVECDLDVMSHGAESSRSFGTVSRISRSNGNINTHITGSSQRTISDGKGDLDLSRVERSRLLDIEDMSTVGAESSRSFAEVDMCEICTLDNDSDLQFMLDRGQKMETSHKGDHLHVADNSRTDGDQNAIIRESSVTGSSVSTPLQDVTNVRRKTDARTNFKQKLGRRGQSHATGGHGHATGGQGEITLTESEGCVSANGHSGNESSQNKIRSQNQHGDLDPVYAEEYTCSICLDLYCCPMKVMPCDHVFCESCLRHLARAKPVSTPCPLCRQAITACLHEHRLARKLKDLFPVCSKIRLDMERKFQSRKFYPLPQNTTVIPTTYLSRNTRESNNINTGATSLMVKLFMGILALLVIFCNVFFRNNRMVQVVSCVVVLTGVVVVSVLGLLGLYSAWYALSFIGTRIFGQYLITGLDMIMAPHVEPFQYAFSERLLPVTTQIRATTANFVVVVAVIILCRYVFFRRVMVQHGRNG